MSSPGTIARRRFVSALTLAVAARPWPGQAQSARVPRVRILGAGRSDEPASIQREPFERGHRELGWEPGATIRLEYRYAEGSARRLEELAAELVRLKVDVIVARSRIAIEAARRASEATPIVMSSAADPVADGFVKSLARPGGNITGIANLVTELESKRLELLKEAIPGLTRVAVLFHKAPHTPETQLAAASRRLGVEAEMFAVNQARELAGMFVAMSQARVGAVLVRADTLLLEPNRAQVTELAARHRLPAMYPWRHYVEAGGLMSYATSIPAFHHRSASYVDRILRGARPGDLPVEQPTKFELVVNLKSAKALGVTIPQSVVLRADEVVE
jgi:putative ABC transport system substrate-binding protein